MIVFRRLITAPLGLLLFFVLLVALIVLQVNDTFLNPGYYPDQLQKADVYRFFLQEVPESALNEARQLPPEEFQEGLDDNPLNTLNLATEDIVSSLNRAVPPEWVEASVEDVFEELGRYINGERNDFELTIQAGDRVVAVVNELDGLVKRSDVYDLFFEAVAAPAIEDALAEGLPLELDITAEEIVASVRRVIPREWLEAQIDIVLDEFTSYLVGESDSFEITIQVSDRVTAALEEVKLLLREADAYEVLYDEVVDPVLEEGLGGSVFLPYGIEVTNDEVSDALRQVAPIEWVQSQSELIIDQASPYIAGESDTFEVLVSLEQNKLNAHDVIAETVSFKIRETINSLPACTQGQTIDLDFVVNARNLPECVPPNIDRNSLIERIEPIVIQSVDSTILGAIPDDIPFTETDLRETLIIAGAEENIRRLDEARATIKSGWTYTDIDLREDLLRVGGAEAVQRFDDARALLSDGWTYTEEDFRQDIVDSGGSSSLENFDQFRSNFNLARTLRWLIFLPITLIVLFIGFLGGRTWSSRIAWSAGSLALTSLVILILASPVYNFVSNLILGDARVEAFRESVADGDFAQTQQLISDKMFDVAENVIDGFASGIALKSGIILAVALITMLIALSWNRINWDDTRDWLRARPDSVRPVMARLRRSR